LLLVTCRSDGLDFLGNRSCHPEIAAQPQVVEDLAPIGFPKNWAQSWSPNQQTLDRLGKQMRVLDQEKEFFRNIGDPSSVGDWQVCPAATSCQSPNLPSMASATREANGRMALSVASAL
jgi:hypothetical protein